MKNIKKYLLALSLFFALDARADFLVVDSSHWELVGNYQTGAALYAACTALVAPLNQNVTTWCGTSAPADNPNSFNHIVGGWIQDRTLPANVFMFYYLNAYACQNNDYVRYFPDTQSCATTNKITIPMPSSPKANGVSCPSNPQNRQPSCGNPIAIGTGNKVQLEVDYAANTPGLALSLSRTYNGGPLTGGAPVSKSFGKSWSQPGDRRLVLLPNTTQINCFTRTDSYVTFCENSNISNSPPSVSATRPDGKIYTFTQTGSQWIADADVDERISAEYAGDGVTVVGWTYLTAQQEIENYSADGRLITITNHGGASQRFTYSSGNTNDTSTERWPADAPICPNVQPGVPIAAGLLVCVTDNWGRQLQFEYDGKSRISKALDPSSQPYLYAYDGPSGGCLPSAPTSLACSANNLTQVTYPDGRVRTYEYNELSLINVGGGPCYYVTSSGNGYGHLLNSLTGITDENGVRFASWGYDCTGRAVSSQHAGGVEKVQVSYAGRSTDGSQTITTTSSIGTLASPATLVRNYHILVSLGVARNDSIDQPCAGCEGMKARTYDANGNVLTSKDWNGNLTTYTYNLSRNLETSRTEASGTPLARTTTTGWHPTMRLPINIASPLRLTTLSYDQNGNLLSKSIQETTDASGAQGLTVTTTGAIRTWSYTYNEFGQLLTITGPLNDKKIISYDSQGNIATTTNAAGHVTTYSNYDENGRVGQITDPNGLITNLSYTPRGWVSSSTTGGETFSYDYDGVGQLTKVIMPDDSTLTYTYDPAHRLTSVVDNDGNSVSYTLDLVGNRIGEQTTDISGKLARNISRVYDPLNRLKQITGGAQ